MPTFLEKSNVFRHFLQVISTMVLALLLVGCSKIYCTTVAVYCRDKMVKTVTQCVVKRRHVFSSDKITRSPDKTELDYCSGKVSIRVLNTWHHNATNNK